MPNRYRSVSLPSQWLRPRHTSASQTSDSHVSRRRPSSSQYEGSINRGEIVDESTLASSRAIPGSPPPNYTHLTLNTNPPDRPTVVVHTRDFSPVDSLPDYDSVPPGPPTDFLGYYNYIVPEMEIVPPSASTIREGFWNNAAFWDPMPYITDPSLPLCTGIYDGFYPAARLGSHNSGLYYLSSSSPSSALRQTLAGEADVLYYFEGGSPPPEVWQCLFLRSLGQGTEYSDDLLFRYRWYHCPDYRARVIAKRQRVDITRSVLYLRRQQTRLLTAPVDVEESEDNKVAEQENNEDIDPSSTSVDLDDFLANSGLEISIHEDPESSVQTTDLTIPADVYDFRTEYLRHGFMPPSAPAQIQGTIPEYPLCTSRRCPLAPLIHRQGPYLDPQRFAYFMVGDDPDADLRSQEQLAAIRRELRGRGLGMMFPEDCMPPVEIWRAMLQVIEGTATDPEGYVDLVERFRYFHCRG